MISTVQQWYTATPRRHALRAALVLYAAFMLLTDAARSMLQCFDGFVALCRAPLCLRRHADYDLHA